MTVLLLPHYLMTSYQLQRLYSAEQHRSFLNVGENDYVIWKRTRGVTVD
jgi:hypothetical protein